MMFLLISIYHFVNVVQADAQPGIGGADGTTTVERRGDREFGQVGRVRRVARPRQVDVEQVERRRILSNVGVQLAVAHQQQHHHHHRHRRQQQPNRARLLTIVVFCVNM